MFRCLRVNPSSSFPRQIPWGASCKARPVCSSGINLRRDTDDAILVDISLGDGIVSARNRDIDNLVIEPSLTPLEAPRERSSLKREASPRRDAREKESRQIIGSWD